MQIYLECYPCFLRQAITASKFSTQDTAVHNAVMKEALQILQILPENATPPIIGDQIHRAVREITKVPDPYKRMKSVCTKSSMAQLASLQKIRDEANDPFEMAVRLAISGNLIDAAIKDEFFVDEMINSAINCRIDTQALSNLQTDIKNAKWILYLADNAGETVFDRLLLELLHPKPVYYVVKGGPALNDATTSDAQEAGIDKFANIITTGYDSVGVIMDKTSKAFLDMLKKAPLIIAKGQANYESLSTYPHNNLYFLLKVKCPVIAQDINANVNDTVIKKKKD